MACVQWGTWKNIAWFKILCWNLISKANFSSRVRIDFKKITVHHNRFVLMEDSIVQFKHLPSNQWVIAINQADNLSLLTMFMHALINVLKGLLAEWVNDDLDFLGWDCFFIYILLDKLSGVFWGMVIDVDYTIVLIILHEDRI